MLEPTRAHGSSCIACHGVGQHVNGTRVLQMRGASISLHTGAVRIYFRNIIVHLCTVAACFCSTLMEYPILGSFR